MEKVEQNTEKFYKELNGDCNIEKLKNIANDKIFLYEPLFKYDKIKYDTFVIKTSFESYQNFMIYTLEQYNEFISLIKNWDENPSKLNKIYPYIESDKNTLFILNNNLINFLVNDKNNENILKILLKFHGSGMSIFLYYLYKYDIISLNTFNIYKLWVLSDEAIIIIYVTNFFYLNDKFYEITKLLKYMEREYLISTIINVFRRDIKILNYVIKNLVKGSLIDTKDNLYRIPATFPIDTLKEYTSKIYKPNEKYLICSKDKNSELFFNTILTDLGIEEICEYYNSYILPHYFYRYNVKFNIPKRIKTLECRNFYNNSSNNKGFNNHYSLNFETKELFDIPFSNSNNNTNSEKVRYISDKVFKFVEKYYTEECDWKDYYKLREVDIDEYDLEYNEILNFFDINYNIFPFDFYIVGYEDLEILIQNQLDSFKKRIFNNDDSMQEILNNIENLLIYNYINEYKNNKIFVSLLKILYIISLIHNNYSTFIILLLLRHLEYKLEYKNNRLYFIKSKFQCMSLEYEFYDLFNSNSIIKKYIELKY